MMTMINGSNSKRHFITEYRSLQGYRAEETTDRYSFETQLRENQMLKELKEGGVWARLASFYVWASELPIDTPNTRLDWKNPLRKANRNFVEFVRYKGYKGVPENSAFIDTMVFLNGETNYEQNNACRFN